jgi:hypothetical protein
MTNVQYWAGTASVGILISMMSGCAAGPGLPTTGSMKVQALSGSHAVLSITADEGKEACGSDIEAKLTQHYAKGFKAGYTDAVHAAMARRENYNFRPSQAKGGDRSKKPAPSSAHHDLAKALSD